MAMTFLPSLFCPKTSVQHPMVPWPPPTPSATSVCPEPFGCLERRWECRSLTLHSRAGSYQRAGQRHEPVWMCSARAAEESLRTSLPGRGIVLLFEVVAPGSFSEASATTRHGCNAKYIFRQFPCTTSLLVLERKLFFILANVHNSQCSCHPYKY